MPPSRRSACSGAWRRPDVWGVPVLLGLAMLANAAMVPLVPYALATRLGWPLWWVGAYSFAVMVITIAVNHRLSSVIDATKRRSLLCLVCGLGQAAAALAGIGALNGLVWLLVLTALGTAVGGAAAPLYYTLGRMITEAEHRDPSRVNSALRVITSAAWMAGPAISFAVVGGHGIATGFTVIAAMAGAGALAVLAASSWLDRRSQRAAEIAAAGSVADDSDGSRSTERVLRHLPAVAVVLLFSFAHIATATSLPLLLVRRFAIPESMTGLLLGLKAAVEMAAILASPFLALRFGPRVTLTIAGAVAALAYGTYLLGAGTAAAVAGSILEGAYYGVFAATALTWVQARPGLRLGKATGLYMNGIYAGVLIGAPLSGLVATYNLGWIAGLSLLAAATAVASLHAARRTELNRS
ncbi:MFS transporter [Microlunatus sp. GCM10028923]|uniref:MFS transporter n=1 Tax=Microlunatus sp. GCM10028923 TaxID=3273400 RepID=UPI00361F4FD2